MVYLLFFWCKCVIILILKALFIMRGGLEINTEAFKTGDMALIESERVLGGCVLWLLVSLISSAWV